MRQSVLIRALEVVGVLFAAFGGFLVGIAPPQAADARFAVGLSSFFALIILLLISSLANKKYRRAWRVGAVVFLLVAVAGAYYYRSTYYALTFEYPPGDSKVLLIAGTEFTPEAHKQRRDNPTISNAELVAGLGPDRVWPEAAVNAARKKLIFSYVFLVMALASSIFSLTEGTLGSANEAKRKRSKLPKAKKQTSRTANDSPASIKSTDPGANKRRGN